jgi:glycosyltransferase involved in cell wall biosynthesis
MTKVLHVYAGNLFGGIETLLVTLARSQQLYPELESQFALCFEGRLSQELAAVGAIVHQLGGVKLSNPWQAVSARARLKRLLRQERFDAVICHACWPQAIFGITVTQMGIPLIFWCHDVPTGKNPIDRLAKFTPPDLVIANSRYTQQHLPCLYPNIPDRVIYCPVAPIELAHPQQVRHRVRQQVGTAADTTVIVQVSRLESWKGHSLAIAALAQIQDLPNWEYWIVGGIQRDSEREYHQQLQHQVHRLGLERRVRFLGERQDVPDLLVAADIFCQPNLSAEPFGIAFIEALYAGLPVVTTAIGGGGEIVTPACGYAVQPGNIDEIAAALRELVEHPAKRQQFRTAAIDRATELCAPRQQIMRLDRAIQDNSRGYSQPSELML